MPAQQIFSGGRLGPLSQETYLGLRLNPRLAQSGQSQQEVTQTIEQGDNSNCKIPRVFFYAQRMPVVVNKNTYTGLKVVNGAEFTAADIIPDPKSPGYHLADDVTIHFGPPLGILLESQETKDLAIPALPPGTVLIWPTTHTLDPANSHYRFLAGKF